MKWNKKAFIFFMCTYSYYYLELYFLYSYIESLFYNLNEVVL